MARRPDAVSQGRQPCSCCRAFATPALNLKLAESGIASLPRSAPTLESLDRIQAAFPGQAQPTLVAAKTNTDAPAFNRAVAQLQARAVASGRVHGPIRVERNPSHSVARISVPIIGGGVDETSTRAMLALRSQLLPATIGTVPGATYAVTGATAVAHDDIQQMEQSLPLVFAFVLTFAFVLMLASFR